MNTFLLFSTLLCLQEAATVASPAEAVAPQMLDLRVQMIGLKDTFEVPEDVGNPAEFLKDQKTQENIIWSREFRTSTIAGREVRMNIGETSPRVTGVTITQGRERPNLIQQQTGALVRLRAKVESDERILLDVNIENSRIDRGNDPDQDIHSEMINTAIKQLTFESEMVVVNGRTKVISCSHTSTDKNAHSENALILITAKILQE